MNNFKKGFFIGSIFSGSLTYLFTNMYIDRYYFLTPNKMSSFIETYKKMNDDEFFD